MFIVTALLLLGAQPSAAPDPTEPKEKLICKREVPIGSLIASRKICLTKSQWEARAKDGNDQARKLVDDNAGRPACTSVNSC
jgi:hypothetical protein